MLKRAVLLEIFAATAVNLTLAERLTTVSRRHGINTPIVRVGMTL